VVGGAEGARVVEGAVAELEEQLATRIAAMAISPMHPGRRSTLFSSRRQCHRLRRTVSMSVAQLTGRRAQLTGCIPRLFGDRPSIASVGPLEAAARRWTRNEPVSRRSHWVRRRYPVVSSADAVGGYLTTVRGIRS
jgi:hypothetical protein